MSTSSNNKEVVRNTHFWLSELFEGSMDNDFWKDKAVLLTLIVDIFKRALEEVSLVVVTNQEGKIVFVSESYLEIMQYERNQLIGFSYSDFLDNSSMSTNDFSLLKSSVVNINELKIESTHRKKKGSLVVLETSVFPLVNQDEKVASLILHQDVTSLLNAEETIKELVTIDVLTGLKNRKQFERDLKKIISVFQPHQLKVQKVAIFFIDLDRFKYYNDTLGHFTGDKLIEVIARELMLFENDDVSVYRYGGDEFTILMKNSSETEINCKAENILQRFQSSFFVNGNELFITATVGVSLFPDTGDTSSSLVQQSEMAMHYAKEKGKDNFQLYNPSLRTKHDERLMIEQRLRIATENKAFNLHYQPQVNLLEKKVVGLEALLRWNDEKLGDVSPSKFIPIAEDSGLIFQIGDWVLEQACYQAKSWFDKGFEMRMGVNISPKQFQRPDFVGKVKNILKKTGVDPKLLDLEITENDLLYNREECFKTLERLKEIGITISIDDFGTGYSSLSYLRQFPIDTLKIDQSFIKEVIENSNDQAIVTSIIQLAHNMKMRVIAEGVETAEMVLFLNERQCDEMQGFLYSKALPADLVMNFIRDIEPTSVIQ